MGRVCGLGWLDFELGMGRVRGLGWLDVELDMGQVRGLRTIARAGCQPGCNHFSTYCFRQRPYSVEHTRSHPNSEVKQPKARSVLGWGTAWEVLRVLLAFCFCAFAGELVGPPVA